MKNIKSIVGLALLAPALFTQAQTNVPVTNTVTVATNAPPASSPASILTVIEQALTSVDKSSGVWESNKFSLYEAAAFSSVSGVPGQSPIGNDLGLIVPVWKIGAQTSCTGFSVALESATRFEAVFGDVAHQQVGASLLYNFHNLRLSGGLAARYRFADDRLLAVPGISVTEQVLGPTAVRIGWDFPAQKKTGAGEVTVGVEFPF